MSTLAEHQASSSWKQRVPVFLAVLATIIWIAIAVCVAIWAYPDEAMKPNEWGDFFAGVSGPLAFFWLIFGYYQQARELRQNTAALKLQADALNAQLHEMSASVLQQKELVTVQRDQIEHGKQLAEKEALERKKSAQPRIRCRATEATGTIMAFSVPHLTLAFKNDGAAVTGVRLEVAPVRTLTFLPSLQQAVENLVASLDSKTAQEDAWPTSKPIYVNIPRGSGLFTVTVRFFDSVGEARTHLYGLQVIKLGDVEMIKHQENDIDFVKP